ncbi:MAG: hypothetical protein ACKVZH_15130 [Blastocatellia bacterium]
MPAKKIEKLLEQALLRDGEMEQSLFDFEFGKDDLKRLRASMVEDGDDYLFAITENTGSIAMVLIEKSGGVLANEQAREKLKELWKSAYERNLKLLIPDFAKQLSDGELPINGVKIAKSQ